MLLFALLPMLLSSASSLPSPASAREAPKATVLALKDDGVSISPERAKSLSPQALGDALLRDADLPVVEATVGPQQMEPPPPPGPPVSTRVRLYLQPTPATEAGFCQQRVATIFLKPVKPMPDGTSPIWTAGDLSTAIAYRRMAEKTPTAIACSAPRADFFTPKLGEAKQALQAVRLLASARTAVRHGRKLAFPLSVEDQLGFEMLAFQREHPRLGPTPGLRVIRNAREALAELPLSTITFVGPASRAYPDILHASDIIARDKHLVEPMTFFLGGEWTVGMVLDGGRITRMRLRRAVAAPF